MEKKHEFYPMFNRTIKNLVTLTTDETIQIKILDFIICYPNEPFYEDCLDYPVILMIKNELDRQYARWNKGGAK